MGGVIFRRLLQPGPRPGLWMGLRTGARRRWRKGAKSAIRPPPPPLTPSRGGRLGGCGHQSPPRPAPLLGYPAPPRTVSVGYPRPSPALRARLVGYPHDPRPARLAPGYPRAPGPRGAATPAVQRRRGLAQRSDRSRVHSARPRGHEPSRPARSSAGLRLRLTPLKRRYGPASRPRRGVDAGGTPCPCGTEGGPTPAPRPKPRAPPLALKAPLASLIRRRRPEGPDRPRRVWASDEVDVPAPDPTLGLAETPDSSSPTPQGYGRRRPGPHARGGAAGPSPVTGGSVHSAHPLRPRPITKRNKALTLAPFSFDHFTPSYARGLPAVGSLHTDRPPRPCPPTPGTPPRRRVGKDPVRFSYSSPPGRTLSSSVQDWATDAGGVSCPYNNPDRRYLDFHTHLP